MNLKIRNFRSIQSQDIDLAPITVVYGANGAGKSSLLYTLLTLKNIVLNPNQPPGGFFNYGGANLGNFKAVVFDHQENNNVELGITLDLTNNVRLKYEVSVGRAESAFTFVLRDTSGTETRLHLPVTFPYPANLTAEETIANFGIIWNGMTAQVQAQGSTPSEQEVGNRIAALINTPVETLTRVALVPHKRGFTKPEHHAVSVSLMMTGEDEIATMLSNEKYVVSKVSHYLEQLLQRDFRVNVRPGTAIFSLDAVDKRTGISTELVNDGFGVNQVVYMLAKTLHQDAGWVCIEEPDGLVAAPGEHQQLRAREAA